MISNPILEEDNAPFTYIKKSSFEGWGLFASKDFVKGDVVIDYNTFESSWYIMPFENLSEEQIRKNWYIIIDDKHCFTNDKYSKFSYINHSRTPNCLWKINERLIIADININKDEELLIDYRLEQRPSRKDFPSWI